MALPDLPKDISEAELKRLELLYDYTKFHIGMYVTLISAVFALIGLDFLSNENLHLMKWHLLVGLIGLSLAGVFGSLVASSVPMTNAKSFDLFMAEKVGPWWAKWISVERAVYTEHTCFWLAMAALLTGALRMIWLVDPTAVSGYY